MLHWACAPVGFREVCLISVHAEFPRQSRQSDQFRRQTKRLALVDWGWHEPCIAGSISKSRRRLAAQGKGLGMTFDRIITRRHILQGIGAAGVVGSVLPYRSAFAAT